MQPVSEVISKAISSGNWKSHFRSLLVHTAQATRLDALFGVRSSSLPLTLAPSGVKVTSFAGLAPNTRAQASLPCGLKFNATTLLYLIQQCLPAHLSTHVQVH